MKRILSLVLILILSIVALTACEFNFPWDNQEPTYDMDNAKGAVIDYYPALVPTKETPVPNTITDFNVTKVLPLKDGEYRIAWSTDNEAVQVVDYVPGENDTLTAETTSTVKVPERPEIGEPDIHYTLTALITAPDGTQATVSFKLKVPAVNPTSFEDYIAAKDGDFVTITGIVTVAHSKTENKNCYNEIFVQDLEGKGGYYVYSMLNQEDLVNKLGVKTGMTVIVSGTKAIYNGTHEIKNAVVEIIDETIKQPTVIDITDKFLAAKNASDASITDYLGCIVTIKNVVIGGNDNNADGSANNYYYYFSLNDLQSYIRLSLSCGLPTEEVDAIKNEHGAHFGWTTDITALVNVYNGSFYLVPASATPFTNLVEPERSPEEKVALESENLVIIDKVSENSTISLPVIGNLVKDVVISWTVDNENFTIGEDGKLVIALGDEEVTLKLTATFTSGDATATKTYEIKVAAASKMPYVHKPISAPVVGTFKIAMNTSPANGKVLYFNGELNDKGALMTTDKLENAVEVIVAVLDEAAGTYSLQVGDKYLEGYLNGNYKNIRFADEPKAWTWNDEAKVFVCDIDGIKYYFGDRDRGGYANTTMALSDIKYITGDNLVKVGVSQFPGFFGTLAPAAYSSAPITAPGAGSFIIVMDTTPANGKPLYFNGELNDKGALMTTDKLENAVEVIVAVLDEAAGTYSLQVGDKYLEGYLNGNYKNIRFADEPKAWTWNDEAKVFVCDIDGIKYYFGDRDRGGYANTTMALSDIKYITGDNLVKVGVSQFPGALSTIEFVSDAPVEDDDNTTGGETPDQPGEGGGETPSTPATPEEVLNALYGLADGSSLEGSFTLTGKITSLDNWNNPTIVVEGFENKPVYCYKLVDSRFVVGATITVTATTLKNFGGTYEMMNCTLDSIVLPEGGEEGGNEGGEVTPPATSGDFVQVTDASQFISGTYVLVAGGEHGLGVVDGTWITRTSSDLATCSTWTLTVDGSSVTLKDANGVFVGPKGGNNNGLKTGTSYSWNWTFNEDGTVTFAGTGSDTVVLAFNTDSQYYKFRGYKTTTAADPEKYPSTFVVYKLAE